MRASRREDIGALVQRQRTGNRGRTLSALDPEAFETVADLVGLWPAHLGVEAERHGPRGPRLARPAEFRVYLAEGGQCGGPKVGGVVRLEEARGAGECDRRTGQPAARAVQLGQGELDAAFEDVVAGLAR